MLAGVASALDLNVSGFRLADGQIVAFQGNLKRISKGGTAFEEHLRSPGDSHIQKPSPDSSPPADVDDLHFLPFLDLIQCSWQKRVL